MRLLSFFILWFSITSFAATQTMPEMAAIDLFSAARTAITQDDPKTAILYLNTLLNMPQNEYTTEAQELIGMARESASETEKAKAEYEIYLKLYPTGVNADRVRKRLLNLKPKETEIKPKLKLTREINQASFNGSVSQYYYGGDNVSSLITSVEGTERYLFNEYDTKYVFRNTQIHNMTKNSTDRNNLNAFYLEQTDKSIDSNWRLGRQNGTNQGALGRFDGFTGRYRVSENYRLTGILGVPDYGSHNNIKTDRYFYGIGIELNNPNINWSGNIYTLEQVADGLTERRAIGGELRYFNGDTSFLGAIDYDTIYKDINLAMIQTNFIWKDYSFSILYDHRKTGIMYAETALSSMVGAVSVSDLRRQLSSGEIYNLVKSVVSESDSTSFNVSKDITKDWNLSLDLRAMFIGATDGNAIIAAQPGIKNNYTYSIRAVGNKILWSTDMVILMASMVDDPQYTARNLSATHSLSLDNWHFTETIRYYDETSNGQTTISINPVARIQYQLTKDTSVEGELNITKTENDTRELLFFGYRTTM